MNREWSVVLHGDADGEVLERMEASRSGVTVVRSCQDLSETLGTVLGGVADGVVFVGMPEDLTVSLLAETRLAGAATVVLSEPPDRELFGLVPLSPAASAELVAEGLGLSEDSEQLEQGSSSDGLGATSPDHALAQASDVPAVERDPDRARLGDLIVVWGPGGAPGRTTIAVNAAAETARAGRSVCLVDADTVAASVGAVLGLVEETSGLSRACRAAERGSSVEESVAELVDVVDVCGKDLAVLTGIPRPERWIEVRRAALAEVLRGLRRTYDVVVADVAAPLEFDDAGILEDGAPQRHGATAECLEHATEILAVGRPDAVGFPRLVREVEALGRLGLPGKVRVLINGVHRNSAGKDPEEQILQAWSRYGDGVRPLAMLPWEPETCGRSLFRGGLWCEEAPSSGLRQRLLEALAETACGIPAGTKDRAPRWGLLRSGRIRRFAGRGRGADEA